MGDFKNIRLIATSLLVLAGMAAVCPQAAHGSLAHDGADVEEAGAGHHEHDSDGHDHGQCEYEVPHTHAVRLSCAPDELATHLLAGYAHVEAKVPAPVPSRVAARVPCRAVSYSPATRLDTVRLLL